MTKKHGAVLVGGLVCILAIYGLRSGLASGRSAQIQVIQGPTQWVAFAADIRTTDHGTETTGRYFRNSQGSTRWEVVTPKRPGVLITIHNLPARTAYVQSPDGDWAQLPIGVRPGPRQLQTRMRGLSLSPETVQGLTVYRYVNPANQVFLKAPDLNFFNIVTEGNGQRREFYNIRREEPSPDLFLPPPNVTVRVAKSRRGLLVPSADQN